MPTTAQSTFQRRKLTSKKKAFMTTVSIHWSKTKWQTSISKNAWLTKKLFFNGSKGYLVFGMQVSNEMIIKGAGGGESTQSSSMEECYMIILQGWRDQGTICRKSTCSLWLLLVDVIVDGKLFRCFSYKHSGRLKAC